MQKEIDYILQENLRRNRESASPFNPVTGEDDTIERVKFLLSDFSIPVQYLPKSMMSIPFIKKLKKSGSIRSFITNEIGVEYNYNDKEKVIEQLIRIRIRYDFPFWAMVYVQIKNKGGGEDVHFRLNRPQRKLISMFEKKRMAGEPIRLILLKARQWGGSTVVQIYMAWLQLVHKVGLNSLIVGHVKDASYEVKDMFDRMINKYPAKMLHQLGDPYSDKEIKMAGVGNSGNIHRIPQRNCKIKIGTAEKPNSARGGDYNLVHCTEVGLWVTTEGKSPEDIIRSACSGVLLAPYTVIVYESTANGTGNFFQREYDAAKSGKSQFNSMFVSWFEIEKYSSNISDTAKFASDLYQNRNNANTLSNREETGKYLWWLWNKGATLEGINWYIQERSKYNDHGGMASEYPSDDVEAFVHSGERVFDIYKVEKLRLSCRPAKYIGDVYADFDEGDEALSNVRFREDRQGSFMVWSLPEIDETEEITDRYLTVVDIGGRGDRSDWSVIAVFDRLFMIDGDKPAVAAQWYGHIDIDLLSWKAAQIAAFYNNALLVIESNTAETRDKDRDVDGDQSAFILNQIKHAYPNLYARRQSEEDIRNKAPRKYGFHTNIATKPMIISTLVKVIRESLYVERDERVLGELLTYEKKSNGAFGAIKGKHDDLLMTRAIGLHICFYEMNAPTIIKRCESTHNKNKTTVSAATI